MLVSPLLRTVCLAGSTIALAALVACSSGPSAQPGNASPAAAPVGASRPASSASPSASEPAVRTSARPAVVSAVIATGGARETNYQIGRDLEKFVGPDAGITLEVLATKGSDDNLHRLSEEARVDLAIVQYDVMQALVDEAKRGNAASMRLTAPLRIVTPLYAEEIYFVVRSDATMKSVDDIKGKRINVGVQGSGSALTATALYRRMFRSSIAASDVRYLTDEQALAALTVDRSIDVVVIVAGQPAKLFADMKAEARDYIKLLPVDGDSPATREALKVYLPATIRARNYSTWLGRDVPTLSVVSFLVTTDRQTNALTPHMAAFARSLCQNFGTLKTEGHPKWREVQLGQQLGFGWKYVAASESELKRCTTR